MPTVDQHNPLRRLTRLNIHNPSPQPPLLPLPLITLFSPFPSIPFLPTPPARPSPHKPKNIQPQRPRHRRRTYCSKPNKFFRPRHDSNKDPLTQLKGSDKGHIRARERSQTIGPNADLGKFLDGDVKDPEAEAGEAQEREHGDGYEEGWW